MKKAIYLTIIALTCLALFFVDSSVAKEEQKKGEGPESFAKQLQPACKSLKYTRIDKDTILITEGFTYQKSRVLNVPHMMGISAVNEGNFFIPEQGSVTIPDFESAVNVTWEFTWPDIRFQRDGCIYTSNVEGATIKFTKEGVLVKNFKISEKPKP